MRSIFNARGFSYPEILLVVTIIMFLFVWMLPSYKRYSALNELSKTADIIRDQLRVAQNRAATGVAAENGSVAHWVVRLYSRASIKQFETGACPVITDSFAMGYEYRYVFRLCPNRSHYNVFHFPEHFGVNFMNYTADDISVFFSSIHGTVRVYDSNGVYLGDRLDIVISSFEDTSESIILRVNSHGVISEERATR